MQQIYFKLIPTLEAFSKKNASILLLVFMFSNLSLFGRNISNDEDETNPSQATVFYSEDVIIYNISGFENAEIVKQKNTNQGEIFVSDVASISNSEYLENTKINKSKLVSKTHFYKKKGFQKEKLVIKKISTKNTIPKSIFIYHNPLPSSKFLHKKIRKVVFSPNKTSSFLKVFYYSEISDVNIAYREDQLRIKYINPFIIISYFSGKHSVRPPTSLS